MDGPSATARRFGVIAMDGVNDGLWLKRHACVVEVSRGVLSTERWEIFTVLAEHLTTLPGLACNQVLGR